LKYFTQDKALDRSHNGSSSYAAHEAIFNSFPREKEISEDPRTGYRIRGQYPLTMLPRQSHYCPIVVSDFRLTLSLDVRLVRSFSSVVRQLKLRLQQRDKLHHIQSILMGRLEGTTSEPGFSH
jgi:hypothetical protein